MHKPARMSDVAKLAGVSTMTVSRVLNDNANVLEETRRRVFSAVEKLNYRRNELARSLREQRSREIGILVPNLYDPFFALCAHVVNGVVRSKNYSVHIATTDENPETESIEAARMLRRHIEGLVVIPAEMGSGGASRLLSPDFEGLPMVTLDRPLQSRRRRVDAVLVENKRGAQTGTEHLLNMGHKRVVFVGLDRRLYTIRMRYDGYIAAMRARGLEDKAVFLRGEAGETSETVRSLIHSRQPPEALFCGNNLLTRQVLHALQALDIHPPDRIALAGFDDFETADLIRPGITVVRQPIEDLARRAAEILFARIADPTSDAAGRRIVLPLELIVRGSCGHRQG